MPTGFRPRSSPANPGRRTPLGTVALGLGTVAVLAAAVILVWSGVTTAQARLAGGTDNGASLLQAAVINLAAELRFEVEPDDAAQRLTTVTGLHLEVCP